MKKLIQNTLFSTILLALGFAPSALAATCTISQTGPDSTNTCTFNDKNVVSVFCENGVNMTNINNQDAESGKATASGNTVSGQASSGDASNINTEATTLSQFCLTAAPVTPTPTPTPSGGGAGAGQSAPQVAGVSTTKVAALPNTGPSSVASSAALSAAGISGALLAAQALVNIYKRRALK